MGTIKKKCYLKDHSTLGDLLCLVNTCEGQSIENKKSPVPFYNWLNVRDSLPQSMVQGEPSLDNWLEW